jgi:hypothetical protein
MPEAPPPPFVDNGQGYPTPESARAALDLFKMGRLADVPVNFRGHEGSVVDLVARCRIERLTENWPQGFVGQVVGIATQAAQGNRT